MLGRLPIDYDGNMEYFMTILNNEKKFPLSN